MNGSAVYENFEDLHTHSKFQLLVYRITTPLETLGGDFSWESGGTLPKISLKPFQDL